MEQIVLFLHTDPNSAPITATVNCHATADDLEQYLDGPRPHNFYFKDIPICPSFTFKWFGISDGTHIFVDMMEPSAANASTANSKSKSKNNLFGKKNNNCNHITNKKKKKMVRSQEAPPMLYNNNGSGNGTITDARMRLNDLNAESARVKDQFFRKVEGTVVCYRKIMKRFTHVQPADHQMQCRNQAPTVINESPIQPSTDELPIFWGDTGAANYSTIASPITTNNF